jgi:methylphosphotriester-DNA--protein-cysteine methyltransferase
METISGLDAEALNRARISRDPRFDGKFYIAVTSTGIYCRPICPSRYAKRSNVRFFASAAAAEAAGFRPAGMAGHGGGGTPRPASDQRGRAR